MSWWINDSSIIEAIPGFCANNGCNKERFLIYASLCYVLKSGGVYMIWRYADCIQNEPETVEKLSTTESQ
jgi:hypothetical protein